MAIQKNTLGAVIVIAAVVGLAVWAGQPSARNDGVSGKTQSATGCSCHSSTPAAGVVVQLSGPQGVLPGSTHSYTISVTGGPAGTTGGFDLSVTDGALTPGIGSKLLNGDLVQVDNVTRTWTFDWTAPDIAGAQRMYAVGLSSNGSGSSGDGWNFSGGALNVPFVITVDPLVGVEPVALAPSLGRAFPNPAVDASTIAFTLPSAGNVDLDIVSVTGRRVATLVSGFRPEGTTSVRWNGRTDDGSSAPVGFYYFRLRAAGIERTARLVLLH